MGSARAGVQRASRGAAGAPGRRAGAAGGAETAGRGGRCKTVIMRAARVGSQHHEVTRRRSGPSIGRVRTRDGDGRRRGRRHAPAAAHGRGRGAARGVPRSSRGGSGGAGGRRCGWGVAGAQAPAFAQICSRWDECVHKSATLDWSCKVKRINLRAPPGSERCPRPPAPTSVIRDSEDYHVDPAFTSSHSHEPIRPTWRAPGSAEPCSVGGALPPPETKITAQDAPRFIVGFMSRPWLTPQWRLSAPPTSNQHNVDCSLLLPKSNG